MCTVILSIGPGRAWPMLVAANRDEKLDRKWAAPAPHWPDQPDVTGGLDLVAGGTWLAVNTAGVVAAVLNRLGSLGPVPGKRSRGELPLRALRHKTAAAAALSFAGEDSSPWRSFNLVLADRHGAWFLRGTGHGKVHCQALPAGVHMVTAREPDDFSSPRIARNLMRFRKATRPNPPEWSDWPRLLSDRTLPMDAAINIPPFSGFGTASSALVGLAEDGGCQFMFAAGPPDEAAFQAVALQP